MRFRERYKEAAHHNPAVQSKPLNTRRLAMRFLNNSLLWRADHQGARCSIVAWGSPKFQRFAAKVTPSAHSGLPTTKLPLSERPATQGLLFVGEFRIVHVIRWCQLQKFDCLLLPRLSGVHICRFDEPRYLARIQPR